ncbi:adenylate/guanylate cyclase domain-containing protein [Prochlorothrix hollandica]|uniref:adenylate/guanylate cyclase domain-containing protein n=1 Tax=Prochlorothrix hollandica TaxID=1223 RepID=UPI00333F31C2
MVSARWITQPIQRVSNAAQEIALGHLDRRVNSSGIEELKVLGGAFNQMAQQLQQSFHALEEANLNLEVTVKQRTAQLELEKEKSERLLLNILPDVIAQQLKQGSVLIADYSEEVSILFADIVGFTLLASQISPIDLVKLLNHIFSTFDELAETFKLEKIKTIGDAYMVVAGLPVSRSDHAEAVANMALAMQDCMDDLTVKLGYKLQLRIGINTGVVVAGVIGIKKFNYDLWGDAVNVASRMESSGEPARIQVTQDTYDRIHHLYEFQARGPTLIKGKGTMETYWLLDRKV